MVEDFSSIIEILNGNSSWEIPGGYDTTCSYTVNGADWGNGAGVIVNDVPSTNPDDVLFAYIYNEDEEEWFLRGYLSVSDLLTANGVTTIQMPFFASDENGAPIKFYVFVADELNGSSEQDYRNAIFPVNVAENAVTNSEYIEFTLGAGSQTSNQWNFFVTTTAPPCSVFINEIHFAADDGKWVPDWIELYNRTSGAIDLSNWWIKTGYGDLVKIGPNYDEPGWYNNNDTSWNGFVYESTIPANGFFHVISNNASNNNRKGVFRPDDQDYPINLAASDRGTDCDITHYKCGRFYAGGDWGDEGEGINGSSTTTTIGSGADSGFRNAYTSFTKYRLLDSGDTIELWKDTDGGGSPDQLHCSINYNPEQNNWEEDHIDAGNSIEYVGAYETEFNFQTYLDGNSWNVAHDYDDTTSDVNNNSWVEIDGDDYGFNFPNWWTASTTEGGLGLNREEYDFSGNYSTPLKHNSTAEVIIGGCTDQNANNYDSGATVDNGTCLYNAVTTCTDPAAINSGYDASFVICAADEVYSGADCPSDDMCLESCYLPCNQYGVDNDCCEFPLELNFGNIDLDEQTIEVLINTDFPIQQFTDIEFEGITINSIITDGTSTSDWASVTFSGNKVSGVIGGGTNLTIDTSVTLFKLNYLSMAVNSNLSFVDNQYSDGTIIQYESEAPSEYASSIVYGASILSDCNGDPGGVAFPDDCGVCSGGNTSIIPNCKTITRTDGDGTSTCDMSSYTNQACLDYIELYGSTGTNEYNPDTDSPNLDSCCVCSGNNQSSDCEGTCGGTLVEDCAGECGGSSEIDDCGICGGDNSSCTGCQDEVACNYDAGATLPGDCDYTTCCNNGTTFGGQGDCDCNGSFCPDGAPSDSVCTQLLDECNVCGGDDSSCSDCASVPNGSNLIFTCGEDNSEIEGEGDASSLPCGSGGCALSAAEAGCFDYLNSDCECCTSVNCGCNNVCESIQTDDFCGECNGDNTTCCNNGSADTSTTCSCTVISEDGAGSNVGNWCDTPGQTCGGPLDDQYCCTHQYDNCGICGGDDSTCTGCMDGDACNYDSEATIQGSCEYAETYYDCLGNCLNDSDGDGICDELEVAGCTDSGACNYDSNATDDNGTCWYVTGGGDCECEDGEGASADCEGTCLGDVTIDDCQICGGNNICSDSSTGTMTNNVCVCADGGYSCFSGDDFDRCGVCSGGATEIEDWCGEASGDNCCDCQGTPGGSVEPITYWEDADGDGFGAGDGVTYCPGDQPSGWVANNADEDDSCVSNEFDCNGACDGDWVEDGEGGCCPTANLDCEGTCDGGLTNDCEGSCGGDVTIDECGCCGGSGIPAGKCDCERNAADTAYECGSGNWPTEDECGVCNLVSTYTACSELGSTYTCGDWYCPNGFGGGSTTCDQNNGCGCGVSGVGEVSCDQCGGVPIPAGGGTTYPYYYCVTVGTGADYGDVDTCGLEDDCGVCGGNGSASGDYVTCCDDELVCLSNQCQNNLDDCGVCSNYTIGSPLDTITLDDGTPFPVYWGHSKDCSGVCYDDARFGSYYDLCGVCGGSCISQDPGDMNCPDSIGGQQCNCDYVTEELLDGLRYIGANYFHHTTYDINNQDNTRWGAPPLAPDGFSTNATLVRNGDNNSKNTMRIGYRFRVQDEEIINPIWDNDIANSLNAPINGHVPTPRLQAGVPYRFSTWVYIPSDGVESTTYCNGNEWFNPNNDRIAQLYVSQVCNNSDWNTNSCNSVDNTHGYNITCNNITPNTSNMDGLNHYCHPVGSDYNYPVSDKLDQWTKLEYVFVPNFVNTIGEDGQQHGDIISARIMLGNQLGGGGMKCLSNATFADGEWSGTCAEEALQYSRHDCLCQVGNDTWSGSPLDLDGDGVYETSGLDADGNIVGTCVDSVSNPDGVLGHTGNVWVNSKHTASNGIEYIGPNHHAWIWGASLTRLDSGDYYDCTNTCDGDTVVDECGVCGGDNSTCTGCMDSTSCTYDSEATIPGGTCLYEDCAGGCTCNTTWDSNASHNTACVNTSQGDSLSPYDDCGVCGGDGPYNCTDCSGTYCSDEATECPQLDVDGCGNCSSTPGVPGTGFTHTCLCEGQLTCNDETECDVQQDICGVCGGTGEISYIPNTGSPGTEQCCETGALDTCGICDGDSSAAVCGAVGQQWNGSCDCNGDSDGSATCDDCLICSGGNSGHTANSDKDACGVCFGDNTSCNVLLEIKNVTIDSSAMTGSAEIWIENKQTIGYWAFGFTDTSNFTITSVTNTGLIQDNNFPTYVNNNIIYGDYYSAGAVLPAITNSTPAKLLQFNFTVTDPGTEIIPFKLSFDRTNVYMSDGADSPLERPNDTGIPLPEIFWVNGICDDSNGEEDGGSNCGTSADCLGVCLPPETIHFLGCTDAYATNCSTSGSSIGECLCEPSYQDCITIPKDSECTYPTISIASLNIGGICEGAGGGNDGSTCYNDLQCDGTCGTASDVFPAEISDNSVYNPILSNGEGYYHEWGASPKLQWTYDTFDNPPLYWEGLSPDPLSLKVIRKDDNVDVYTVNTFYSSPSEKLYPSNEWFPAVTPGDLITKYRIEWPTSGTIKSETSELAFTLRKSGCIDSKASATCDGGYNSYATYDCDGTLDGTNNDCCEFLDYESSCCLYSDMDDCEICDGGTGFGILDNYYADYDDDGIGCLDSGAIGYCPNLDWTPHYATINQPPAGWVIEGNLSGNESGEACDCAFPYTHHDEICWSDISPEINLCQQSDGVTGADACGVCPYYTNGNRLIENQPTLDGVEFGVYYNHSQDCAGTCSPGTYYSELNNCPAGEGWSINTNSCKLWGAYNDECLVCSDGNSGHTANENLDDCGVCHTPGLTSNPPHLSTSSTCFVDNEGSGIFDDSCPADWGTPSNSYYWNPCQDCHGVVIDGDSGSNTTDGACNYCKCPDQQTYDSGTCGDNNNLMNIGTCVEGSPEEGQPCVQIDASGIVTSPCGSGSQNSDCFVIGPDAGCSGICVAEGSAVDTLDVLDQCCFNTQTVNAWPDMDETGDSKTGELGYCSDTGYSNENECTGDWYVTIPISVCAPQFGGQEEPILYDGQNQPGAEAGTEFSYYFVTDDCFGYIDSCGVCWSLDEAGEAASDIFLGCDGVCYSGHLYDECNNLGQDVSNCMDPECRDFGVCSVDSGGGFDETHCQNSQEACIEDCGGNWNTGTDFTSTVPDDYTPPPYISQNPCTSDTCGSGVCIPTNPLWNNRCTGCTNEFANNYFEACQAWGYDCLFDDGTCEFDAPVLESVSDGAFIVNQTIQNGVNLTWISYSPTPQFAIQRNYPYDYYGGEEYSIGPTDIITTNNGTEYEYTFLDMFPPESVASELWPTDTNEIEITYRILDITNSEYSNELTTTLQIYTPSISVVEPEDWASDDDTYNSNEDIPIELNYDSLFTDGSENEIHLKITTTYSGNVEYYEYLPISLQGDLLHEGWIGDGNQVQSDTNSYWYCPFEENWTEDEQYFDEESCNAVCEPLIGSGCVTYHNTYFNLGGKHGPLWDLIWPDETGEPIQIDVEYPNNYYTCDDGSYCGSTSDSSECSDGTTTCTPSILDTVTIKTNVITGCMDEPTGGGWLGACNCITCGTNECCNDATYTPCDNDGGCEIDSSCVPSPIGNICQPDTCFDEGFYNPKASVGYCWNFLDENDASNGLQCHNHDDCGANSDGDNKGCLCSDASGIPGTSCYQLCTYPKLGCMDDGNMPGGRCNYGDSSADECFVDSTYSSETDCIDGTPCLAVIGETYVNNHFGFGSVTPGVSPVGIASSGEYDTEATYEDGSCSGYYGCTDRDAINYYGNIEYTNFNIANTNCSIDWTYEEGCPEGDASTCCEPAQYPADSDVYIDPNTIYGLQSKWILVGGTCVGNTEPGNQAFCDAQPANCDDESQCPGGTGTWERNDGYCIFPFQYNIGYRLENAEGFAVNPPLERSGYVFLENDNNTTQDGVPQLIRRPFPFTDDENQGGGPASSILYVWVLGAGTINGVTDAYDNVWYPSEGVPGELLTSDSLEIKWYINDVEWTPSYTIEGTNDNGCSDICAGFANDPIMLDIPIYNPLEINKPDTHTLEYNPSQLDDIEITLRVDIKDLFMIESGVPENYATITKELDLTFIRNDIHGSQNLPQGSTDTTSIRLDYDPDGDGLNNITYDIDDVYDASGNFQSGALTPFPFSMKDVDGDLFTVDVTVTPITGVSNMILPEVTTYTFTEINNEDGAGADWQSEEINFKFKDLFDQDGNRRPNPKGTYLVTLTSRWNEMLHDVYNMTVEGDFTSDFTPYYIQEEFIEQTTFEMYVIDTRGPEGDVGYSIVSSFGVSPDRYEFRPAGDDMRDYIVNYSPEVVEGVPESYIVNGGFGTIGYEYDPENDSIGFYCQEQNQEIDLITYYVDGKEYIDTIVESFQNADYEFENNVINPTLPFGFCSEDSIISYTDEDGNPQLSVDISGSPCSEDNECRNPDDTIGDLYGGFGKCEEFLGEVGYQNNSFVSIQTQFADIFNDGSWPSYNCFNNLTVTATYTEYVEAVDGTIVQYDNTNLGGWLPKNAIDYYDESLNPDGTDPYDTVWKYELLIYQCAPNDPECITSNSTLLHHVVFSDWADQYEDIAPYHGLSQFYPPQQSSEDQYGVWQNLWTNDGCCALSGEGACLGGYGQQMINTDPNVFLTCNENQEICESGTNEFDCGGEWTQVYSEWGEHDVEACTIAYGTNNEDPQDGANFLTSCTTDLSGTPRMGTVREFLENGYTYQFLNEGLHKAVIKAYDLRYNPLLNTSSNVGESETIFNVDWVFPIIQSVKERYNPWKGINIPENAYIPSYGEGNIFSKKNTLELEDVDDRPSLGCFLYREDNPDYRTWSALTEGELSEPFNLTASAENLEGNEFSIDCDVRCFPTLRSGSAYSTPLKYYDEELQPEEYKENMAPVETQFYFYPREAKSLLSERNSLVDTLSFGKDKSTWFIYNLNFGDGSKPKYKSKPFQLWNNGVIKHNYKEDGIYDVTGWAFNVKLSQSFNDVSEENIVGIDDFQKFNVRINLGENTRFSKEFESLGGESYTYLPYPSTTPIVGGLSSDSVYYKSIKRNLGYIGGSKSAFDLKFSKYKDKIDAEYALAKMDENYIGKEISKFTGSFLSISQPNDFSEDYQIQSYYDNWTNTGGEFISASKVSGFYSGSVDSFGYLENTTTPILINKGKFKNFGEMGKHLGDVDLGQTRYYEGQSYMWEQLGFEDVSAGNPSSPNYWNNIIPKSYKLEDRQGVTISDNNTIIVDETSLQEWEGINEYGNTYYYPVLPMVDENGKFDELKGLQGDKIPFGSPGTKWNGEDKSAPITSEKIKDQRVQIDLSMKEISSNDEVEDSSGNKNIGIVLNDYGIKYDKDTNEPTKLKDILKPNLENDENKKSY